MLFLTLVGCGVLFVGFAVISRWALQQSTQRILEERLVLSQVAAGSIDRYNQDTLYQLDGVAGLLVEPMREGDISAAREVLEGSQALSKGSFKEMLLLDNQGHLLVLNRDADQSSKTYVPGKDAPDLSSYAFMGAVINSGEPRISGMVSSQSEGTPTVVYSVPVRNSDGAVLGVLGGAIDLPSSAINGFIQAIKLEHTGYAQVVDGRGELIASTQPDVVFGKSDHGDRFVSLIQESKGVVRTCHSCHLQDSGQNQRRKDIMAFSPLQSASWGIAVRQAEDEAFGPTRKLRNGIVGVGIISLVFGVPAMALVVGRAIRPVRMLTTASRRMASGDLDTRIQAMGVDEVGTLAENLEYMRKALKESRAELEERRREAEALYDIGTEISGLLDVDKILKSVVEKAMQLLSADAAGLMLQDESGQLNMKVTSGAMGEALQHLKLSPGQGFAGAVVRRGYILSSEDYLNDATFQHEKAVDKTIDQEGLRSHVGVPLRLGKEIVGALVVSRRQIRAFTELEMALLARLANQASIAVNNARLYEEVRRREDLRGQLLDKVISAQEEERKRIARELHDEPAQIFSALVMQLEALAQDLPAGEAPLKQRVQRQQTLAAHALETVRKLMSDLRPTALDDLGLVPAIRQYAESRLGDTGVKVTVRTSEMDGRLPGEVETGIFRVMQEAVNNIYKHAGARHVRISLQQSDGIMKVTAKDDGNGFDVGSVVKNEYKGTGLGLLGIQERVTLMGGSFHIYSRIGKGTELRIEVPLAGGVNSVSA